MEKLLEMAKGVSEQAEVYSFETTSDGVGFENAKLKEIDSKMQSGMSLRIIKDGKLGFAYTRNLRDREELLQNAVDSLKGGVEGLFDLPGTSGLPPFDTYDPSLEHLTNSAMVEECRRVCDILAQKTKGQINLSSHRSLGGIRLINSRGTDLSEKYSSYSFGAEILYPGSYAAIHRSIARKGFERVTVSYTDFLLGLYNRSSKEIDLQGGKMKVLFLPETVYVLMGRLLSGTNGRNIHQKVSPVLEKRGQKLFDETFTLYDDPLNDQMPGARRFDDEGIPCRFFPLVENGVLVNFYYDLFYARKLGAPPTGHGYKGSISSKPSPSLEHLYIKPGKKSFASLVASIDRGVIVPGVLGSHSGNILNGDYSVGLSPGLYVEQGEIVGHVKDAMVAGNIYETLRNIAEMEDTALPSHMGTFPSILFDQVSVATKSH
jgi:PmbA protein